MCVEGLGAPCEPATSFVANRPASPPAEFIEPLARWCGLAALSLARCHRRPDHVGALVAADGRYPIWLKTPCARVQRAILAAGYDGPEKSIELEANGSRESAISLNAFFVSSR